MEQENFKSEIDKEIEADKKKKEKESLEKNKILFKKYLVFFVVVMLVTGSFFIGYRNGQKKTFETKSIPLKEAVVENKDPAKKETVDFSLFWKVWDPLKEKHIEKDNLDAQKLVYGAINGMLSATGDPYSNFLNPEENRMFSSDIAGSFDGIGAELGIKDEVLTIIAPLDGSPSQKAGLRSGDKILKIDDKPSLDLTIDQAVDLIRGKAGSDVKLTILHQGDQETLDIIVTRETIKLDSVKISFKENDITYIEIVNFSENADLEFEKAAAQAISSKSRGIILDLRDNPGGLLQKSIDIASWLIPRKKVVVIEEDNTGRKKELETYGGDKLSSIPCVVLINEGSASAAEILAGALRDNQGIILIGKKTFGKGSVQELIDLPGGSSVKITVAKWLTPRGDYIMDKGISPDIEVEMTSDDYKNNRDPQLDKALEIIKEKI